MSQILKKLHNYLLLIRFDKPIGTMLLLWPTFWGLWIASRGFPPIKILIVFILGVFLSRSLGCVLNDLADRNFDAHVNRTQHRPLVTSNLMNRVSLSEALIIILILSGLALILVLSLQNIKLLYHSCIALMLAGIYPLCKRFFVCPQFVLGLAFGYSIPMAYVATQTDFTQMTWLLYSASILLTIIYDNFYAMSDSKDDAKLGLKSSALFLQQLFGSKDLIAVAVLQIMFIIIMCYIGYVLEARFLYVALLLVAMLFIYQILLASTRVPKLCLIAFKNSNFVGMLIFLGLLVDFNI